MCVSPPLLSILLMQAAPAAEPRQVFPASMAVSVAGGLSRQGPTYHGRSGEARLAVDWFVRRPVVDDGTPYGLQPYLQRANRIFLGVEGALSSMKADATPDDYSDKSFAARLGGLFHRGWSVFGVEVDYAHVVSRPPVPGSTVFANGGDVLQTLRPAATFGVRDKALELRLSYIFTAILDNGVLRKPGWGQAKALGTFVLDNATFFSLAAFTLPEGGGASAKFETFPNPGLGLWLGGDYQEEQFNIWNGSGFDVVGYAIAHAEVGVEWWHSNRFALQGWLRGGMIRETIGDRSAYGTETPYLELLANLGIVMRLRRSNLVGTVPPAAY